MKTSFLITLVCLYLITSLAGKAQVTPKKYSHNKDTINFAGSHIITYAPLGFIYRIRFRYEYVALKKFSIGAQVTNYSAYYPLPGWQAVAIGRYYLSNRPTPLGFYLMAQAGLAYHHATAYEGPFNSYIPGSYNQYAPYTSSHEVSSLGLMYGIGIGHQETLGKKQIWILDTYIGIRGFKMNKNLDDVYILNKDYGKGLFSGPQFIKNQFTDSGVFFGSEFGVGGFINIGINIGYRF